MAFTEYVIALDATFSQCLSDSGRNLAIASDGTLWGVYSRRAGAVDQIFVAYSIDNGVTWTEEQVIPDANNQRFPSIAIDSADVVHIIYSARGRAPFPAAWALCYNQRAAGVWAGEEVISCLNTGGNVPEGTFVIDSADNVHVVFTSLGYGVFPGVSNIKYRQRIAGVWGAVQSITDLANGQSIVASAMDSLDNLHIAWTGFGWGAFPARLQIVYAVSPAFVPEQMLSENLNDTYPAIAVDSGNIPHVGFARLGAPNWSYQYINRGGGVWSAPLTVYDTNDVADASSSIAVDRVDDIHFVFEAFPPDFAYPVQIMYNKIEGGVLQVAQMLSDDLADGQAYPFLIWATWPQIGGVRTNIVVDQRIIWRDVTESIKFGWFPPIPIPLVTTLPATVI